MQPSSTPQRLFFTVTQWILALLIFVLIGLGWYLQYLPQTAPERSFFINLHISLGLTGAILLGFQILLGLILGSFSLSGAIPRSQGSVTRNLYILIYVCVAIIGISGFLQAIASVISIKFWGLSIPVWRAENPDLALLYGALHQVSSLALTVLVIILVGVFFLKFSQKKKLPYTNLPEKSQQQTNQVNPEIVPPTPPKAILKLRRNLRLLGWVAFWVQLVLGIISVLLFLVVSSGQTISVNVEGPTGGSLLAKYSFALLCLTIIFFFYCTRFARKIALNPDYYINPKKQSPPWFLKLNYKISLVGTLISFIGVGASVALLMAKTVSQPPGIAITDPSKIVRALDVLILLINFELLIAHFVGGSISIWIAILASNTYKRVLSTTPALRVRVEEPSHRHHL